MPAGDPRDISWGDINNKAGFVSFCVNGNSKNGGLKKEDKDDSIKAPYLLVNCAFDPCNTKLYQDRQVTKDDNGQPLNGNCQLEINDDESITVQNIQKKASLKIVDPTQINSLGKVISE